MSRDAIGLKIADFLRKVDGVRGHLGVRLAENDDALLLISRRDLAKLLNRIDDLEDEFGA